LLYRKSTHAAAFEQALLDLGIACRREESKGFFARVEIQDCLALLRWLALPQDDIALATILRSPWVNWRDAQMINFFRNKKQRDIQNIDQELAAKLQLLSHATTQMRPSALLRMADDLFQIASRYGAMPMDSKEPANARVHAADAAQSQDNALLESALAKSNLVKLQDILMTLETAGRTGILEILKIIDGKREEDDEGLGFVGQDAVTLMTIHKSKGLEFPFVVLVATDENFEGKNRYFFKKSKGDLQGVFTMAARKNNRANSQRFRNY